MKKLTIAVFILLILIISISSYINFENIHRGRKREWHLIGEYGPFYFYNGTRYPYKDFSDVFISEENDIFELSFRISFEGYSETIFIKYMKSEYPFKPYNVINNSGYYHIQDLVIKPNLVYGEYPYDVYNYNISLWTINDTYGKPLLNYLKYDYSSDNWNIRIYGEWNKLFFTLQRTSEISTYVTIKQLCIYSFIFSVISILFLWIFNTYCKNKKFNNYLFSIVNAIILGEFAVFVISIVSEYLLFQIYKYYSSQYVQYLGFIWFAMIFSILFFKLYIKKYES